MTTAARSCRACGCTDDRACPGGCYWTEADLCSACELAELESIVAGLAAAGECPACLGTGLVIRFDRDSGTGTHEDCAACDGLGLTFERVNFTDRT